MKKQYHISLALALLGLAPAQARPIHHKNVAPQVVDQFAPAPAPVKVQAVPQDLNKDQLVQNIISSLSQKEIIDNGGLRDVEKKLKSYSLDILKKSFKKLRQENVAAPAPAPVKVQAVQQDLNKDQNKDQLVQRKRQKNVVAAPAPVKVQAVPQDLNKDQLVQSIINSLSQKEIDDRGGLRDVEKKLKSYSFDILKEGFKKLRQENVAAPAPVKVQAVPQDLNKDQLVQRKRQKNVVAAPAPAPVKVQAVQQDLNKDQNKDQLVQNIISSLSQKEIIDNGGQEFVKEGLKASSFQALKDFHESKMNEFRNRNKAAAPVKVQADNNEDKIAKLYKALKEKYPNEAEAFFEDVIKSIENNKKNNDLFSTLKNAIDNSGSYIDTDAALAKNISKEDRARVSNILRKNRRPDAVYEDQLVGGDHGQHENDPNLRQAMENSMNPWDVNPGLRCDQEYAQALLESREARVEEERIEQKDQELIQQAMEASLHDQQDANRRNMNALENDPKHQRKMRLQNLGRRREN